MQTIPLEQGNLLNIATNPPTMDGGSKLTTQIKDGNGNYGFYNPLKNVVATLVIRFILLKPINIKI